MEIKRLYRYEREPGKVTVSTDKPTGEYTGLIRLIAADGKLLTKDGKTFCGVVDVDDTAGWYEVDDPFFALELVTDENGAEFIVYGEREFFVKSKDDVKNETF